MVPDLLSKHFARRGAPAAAALATSALALALALTAAPDARAEAPIALTPGALVSWDFESELGAIGGELSAMFYPGARNIEDGLGYGAFLQVQTVGVEYERYAFGAQFGQLVGVELGAAYLSDSDNYRGSWGAQLGAYGSLGFLCLGFRATLIPSTPGDQPSHLSEYALTLKFGIPIMLQGRATAPMRFSARGHAD
jgi:hypothetical protein